MALDGLTIAALRKELADFLTEGRIQKIVQTEKDELFFTIKTAEDLGRGRQVKLYLSAQASLPLAYLCEETKAAPPAAPS
ncbi:MAG: fibronectin/fibrinogen-binding protein, partial [Lachnospiraceae bacterium]|nr:fibronectin/fibrinogen-binding protein [Lachnospiraceae bacterium]